MYAVAFDLTVVDTEKHHPKGVSQAYTEIGAILGEHGFRRVQGSLYVTDDEDIASFWRFNHYAPARGFQNRYVTFAHSASNSGPTSPLL
jgi:virulence-associated protein VapD